MMETISVLAVVFIIIIIFYAFYSNTFVDIDAERDRIRQLEAANIMQQALFLAEVQCSERGFVEDYCIDILKVKAASEIIMSEENKMPYFDKFGFSRITIKQIYPEIKDISVIYDNSIGDYSYKDLSNMPVSLFDPMENKHYFGAITVEMFSK
ncbi:MAG: hypothetical protein AABX34_04125 [Nanoarchaeota archaeon]